MPAAKPYHHGNLRLALLDAAIHLIADVGPVAFTLREVARRAGVSHNTPYRHFRDRDDLMAAVAEQGFRELTQAMLQGAGSHARARDRRSRPGWPTSGSLCGDPSISPSCLMPPISPVTGTPIRPTLPPGTFGTLVEFVEASQEQGSLPRGDTLRLALLARCTVHGVAKLAVAGRLPFGTKPEVFDFAAYVIDHSLSPGENT